MIFEAINIVKVSGTKSGIKSEEQIYGQLEYVPCSDGTALLMLPVEKLMEMQKIAQDRGGYELPALSKMDIHKRAVLCLGKNEVKRIYAVEIGEKINFVRKGWGRTWNQCVKRIV